MIKDKSFFGLVLIVLTVMSILGFLYFKFPCNGGRDVRFVIELFVMAAGIITAIYVGRGFYYQAEWSRANASFNLLNEFNNNDMGRNRTFLEKRYLSSEKYSFEELEKDDVFWNAFLMLGGFFEDISIAVQRRYVDEELIYFSLRNIVKKNWEGLRCLIIDYRNKEKHPYYLSEFQKMADYWREGLSMVSGKKFPQQFNGSDKLKSFCFLKNVLLGLHYCFFCSSRRDDFLKKQRLPLFESRK